MSVNFARHNFLRNRMTITSQRQYYSYSLKINNIRLSGSYINNSIFYLFPMLNFLEHPRSEIATQCQLLVRCQFLAWIWCERGPGSFPRKERSVSMSRCLGKGDVLRPSVERETCPFFSLGVEGNSAGSVLRPALTWSRSIQYLGRRSLRIALDRSWWVWNPLMLQLH